MKLTKLMREIEKVSDSDLLTILRQIKEELEKREKSIEELSSLLVHSKEK